MSGVPITWDRAVLLVTELVRDGLRFVRDRPLVVVALVTLLLVVSRVTRPRVH